MYVERNFFTANGASNTSTFRITVIEGAMKSFIKFGIIHLINELRIKFGGVDAIMDIAKQ